MIRGRSLGLLAGLMLLAALGSGGCGYSTGSMMPPGLDSVAVGIFGNETFYRHAEITYTRELTRTLVRNTHLVVRDPDEARAILRGRILTIPRLTLVEDELDRILEGGVVVSVEVHLEDALTGERLMEPFVVNRRAEYIVPRRETLQTAIDEAVRDAARDTVNRLQAQTWLAQRRESMN